MLSVHFLSVFSTKYTGIFTFLTVGFLTGRDLWKLIGDHTLPAVSARLHQGERGTSI